MTALLATDRELTVALESCVNALRLLAESEIPPKLEQRMHTLGENKEFLDEEEREELSDLVDFWRKRVVEKLEAQVALKRLRDKLPMLFDSP